MTTPDISAPRRGFRLPYTLRLEQRTKVSGWLPIVTSIGAVIVALIIGAIILWAAGGNPIEFDPILWQFSRHVNHMPY